MDYETKLFDTAYLTARVSELKEIRNKHLGFRIEKSNRENSKSVYVTFLARITPDHDHVVTRLRISDHPLNNTTQNHYDTTYLVDGNRILDKKRKALFMRTLQNCVIKARKSATLIAFNKTKK